MTSKVKKILHTFSERNFIEVIDQGDFRSLYFKKSVVQSRIYRKQPGKLVLKYTQYMMAASLLVQPEPAKILLIGVGAGSLLHFFNTYLPKSSVDAVDYSQHIIKIARGYFSLPENDNIHIHCSDGLHYLTTLEPSHKYDLILLDAFNDQGMARNIYSSEFLKHARQRISDTGIICCNLWSGDKDVFQRVEKAINKNSTNQIYIPVRKRENIIALLFQCDLPWKRLSPAHSILNELSSKYDLDFKEVSISARDNNMRLGDKLKSWLS